MTVASLKECSHKDLAQMAKQGGVRGWHSMRKDQLVKALLSAANGQASKTRTAKKAPIPVRRGATKTVPARRSQAARKPVPRKPTSPAVLRHLSKIKAKLHTSKDLTTVPRSRKATVHVSDRVVVMVRDPYWLHAYWEITRQSVERIQAAMSQDWHTASPILRLLEVTDGGTISASECVVKDIQIHGGVCNWYIHVEEPPKSYRVELGYQRPGGRFYSLARSNVVSTPSPGSSDALDENWAAVAEDFEKIYAMSGGYSVDGNNSTELQELFEERLRRPMGSPMVTRYGGGIESFLPAVHNFELAVDAELIVYGNTVPNAHLTLRGEPVKLRPDGSFTVRLSLPNQRQVIPVVASSADGSQQRTIVLALERNTKVMEPVIRESED